jgi:predicted PhzF superfamily epimerase YddE/YHI9
VNEAAPIGDVSELSGADVTVLRVFVGPDGRGGNPLGVVLHGSSVAPDRRLQAAAALGFSETVFVDDPLDARLQIFTPESELPFAGHPLVGTAWLLRRFGVPPEVLRPPVGEVATWSEGGKTFIRCRAAMAPEIALIEQPAPAAVDAVDAHAVRDRFEYHWAWIDEQAGTVRARAFPYGLAAVEDEATGSAAILLCSALGRPLVISQGAGALLRARPGPAGTVEVGGKVVLDGTVPIP